jgi:DUF1365 family protein
MYSGIYESVVRHQRFNPMGHRLSYSVYSLLIDLDEIDDLVAAIPVMSRNRFNLVSFHDRDFGPRDGSDLREWFVARVAEAGMDFGDGRISMLVFPRILGYTFNPITVWFGHGADGGLKAIVYEVHNTFGHSHAYVAVVPESKRQEVPPHEFDKVLHVSPFFDRSGGYRMSIVPPQAAYSLVIEYLDENGDRLLTATQTGDRTALTTGNLLRQFFTKPLLTIKVIAGIHLEALKLVRKRAKYHKVPPPPSPGVEVARWPNDLPEAIGPRRDSVR